MKWIILVYLFMCFTFVGCSSSSSDQSHSHSHTHDNNDNSSDNDTSDDSHYENDESTSVNMDITLSKALLTTEDGNDAARKHIENARWLGLSPNQQAIRTLTKTSEDESNLKKINEDGEVTSVITTKKEEGVQSLPDITSIGISKNTDVFFQFEYNFIYRNTDDSGEICDDPWADSSPCSCQVFKLKNTLTEWMEGGVTPEFENIECIDNEHRIDQWQQTGPTFQFDSNNNVYYLAGFENVPGTVLYKLSPTKVNGKFQKVEMINRSICILDWRVTKSGGLFYVGENCIDGQWSGEGSFFRYVNPSGALVEISRNWWDYQFEPIEGVNSDQVLFYGPDPDSTEVARWDSACLFKFDPSSEAGSRATKLVTCNQWIYEWVELRRQIDIDNFGDHKYYQDPPFTWRTEYKNRCINNVNTFVGSNSSSPIKHIKQDSTGKAFIVGDISKKNAGKYTCSIEIKGNHCTLDGDPVLRNSSGTYTKSSCESDGGSWIMYGYCSGGSYSADRSTPSQCATASGSWYDYSKYYNDIEYKIADVDNVTNYEIGHICLEEGDNTTTFSNGVTVDNDTDTDQVLRMSSHYCESPSSGWTTDYKGMAFVNPDTKMLDLKSATNEQVTEMWLVNDSLYYSAYKLGWYFMKNVDNTTNTTLLSDFEVYHSGPSVRSAGWLLFDGLDFTNNSYSFGDLNPSAANVKDSIVKATGLTGRVKSMVIYGAK